MEGQLGGTRSIVLHHLFSSNLTWNSVALYSSRQLIASHEWAQGSYPEPWIWKQTKKEKEKKRQSRAFFLLLSMMLVQRFCKQQRNSAVWKIIKILIQTCPCTMSRALQVRAQCTNGAQNFPLPTKKNIRKTWKLVYRFSLKNQNCTYWTSWLKVEVT